MQTLFIDLVGTGRLSFSPQKQVLCPQVSPIDHRLVWVWIGLVWRVQHVELLQKTVERVYRLAVVQLQNPIDHSLWSNRDRVSMRSLVVVEETNMVFQTKLPVFNLSTFGIQWAGSVP